MMSVNRATACVTSAIVFAAFSANTGGLAPANHPLTFLTEACHGPEVIQSRPHLS
ncbi:hypothetical protein SAMN04487926_103119 [Paraburkholderia steynii]|uniref:Uncharacterized protein n=1 Tax=Paraburkholderia steynii TaxID=1245441 RepID=A0A7Z7B273_9BURK|nr:hypothetical protein PMI06_003207 [Burkholderia sp. BT03]SDH26076.1 hypothetical protein SAMN04487926_103119 [Paraburkholderia steynii]SKC60608.1 hypothetical protein SAMN06266956_1125 [Paraburkholderia hospita]